MQSLTVPATLDSLKSIAEFVLAAAASARLDKKTTYKLRLAVDEIATNIILHGLQSSDLPSEIQISAAIESQQLEIVLEDSAVPFDPLKVRAIEAEELQRPLEERQLGGLGVYLAIQGVDQFRYERVGDRNRNIFVVNCVSSSAIASTGERL